MPSPRPEKLLGEAMLQITAHMRPLTLPGEANRRDEEKKRVE
jgi:hypothetical protein